MPGCWTGGGIDDDAYGVFYMEEPGWLERWRLRGVDIRLMDRWCGWILQVAGYTRLDWLDTCYKKWRNAGCWTNGSFRGSMLGYCIDYAR